MVEEKTLIGNLVSILKGFNFLHTDDLVTGWSNTVSNRKLPTEKLVKDTLDDKIDNGDIVDNLTTNDTTKVLSAKQGKVLKDIVDDWEGTYLISDDVKLSNLEWSANLTNYLQIQALNLEGGISAICDRYDSQISSLNTSIENKQAKLSVESTSISVSSATSGSNYFSGGTREILARRYGKIVNVSINFYNVGSKQAGTSTDTTIGTMPSGWRPIFTQYARASYTNKTDIHNTSFMINTSGTISIRTHTATAQTGATYRASFTYIVS